MMKITNSWCTLTLSILASLTLLANPYLTLAQTRGQGPGEFFDRGNEQMQQEINRLQRQQTQEQQPPLEVTTENSQDNPTEETTSPSPNNHENIPNSPEQERDIKQ